MIRYRVGRRTTIPNLFILSGGKIDFADADVTITHTANTLTLAGGVLVVPVGSASAPSITFAGMTTSGLFAATTKGVSITSESTEVVLVARDDFNYSLRLGSGYPFTWASSTAPSAALADLILMREGAAILQQGVDAAAPVAQTFKGPDGSGTDKAGGNMTVGPGRPTGSGTPGILYVATSTPGTTGSSQQALANRVEVNYGYVGFNPVDAAATPVAATAALKLFAYNKSVADDAVVTCPAITTNAFGWCIVGTTAASYTTFMVGSTGTVTLLTDKSADVVANADTDTKLCIGTAATQEPLQIKNRLGSTQVLNITIWYD